MQYFAQDRGSGAFIVTTNTVSWTLGDGGVGLAIKRSWVRFPVGPLSSYLGQLSHPSLRVAKSTTAYGVCLGLRRGAFTYVGWQVTLCDPIWQVTPRSSEMGFP